MKQILTLFAALLFLAAVAFMQPRFTDAPPETTSVQWNVDSSKLHTSVDFAKLARFDIPSGLSSSDTLGEAEVLKRISRLYRYQSAILAAEANEDHDRIERLLDEATAQLDTLMQQPGLADQARFRELYRSLVTEYEGYRGVPDTLSLPRGDIFKERTRMFAALNASAPPPSFEQVAASDLRPTGTTVSLPYNGLVQSAVTYLQREPERHLYRWLRRKETYFPMIEHIFAEENVPDELKYLAMVESGLNPQSESWADAAGLWQFMPTTGRAYGLSITPWVDERLDPVKSTRAAAKHLRDLYWMFDGDWLLALSGYNCSPTKIRRAMDKVRRQGKEPSFWNIYPYIPQETRNYVPTFIATALMVSNPSAFNLKRVRPGPRYNFDYVPVEAMLSLEKVATLADTSVSWIRAFNPELRRATLPPSSEPYYVRLPYGSYERFAAAYKQLPEDEKNAMVTHTVRPNETLDEIAERYDVAVAELARLNKLKHAMLEAGQRLAVPGRHYQGNHALLAEADAKPMSVRYSSRSVRPLAATGSDGSTLAGQKLVMYRVKHGDTLSEIADQYDVSTSQLKSWNGLRSSALRPGQRLKIYG